MNGSPLTIQGPQPTCREHGLTLPCGVIGCSGNPLSANWEPPPIPSEALRAYLVARYGEARVLKALADTAQVLDRDPKATA